MTSGLKSLGSNIVTMNKAGGVQTLQGLQVGGLGGKQTIVINKSGGQTIRYGTSYQCSVSGFEGSVFSCRIRNLFVRIRIRLLPSKNETKP
jgi:hypothetical protein